MKIKPIKISRRVNGALCAITALILTLAGTYSASAGWRAVDAENAWADFQRAFQYTGAQSYMYDFSKYEGGGAGSVQDFWEEANLIDLACDAYEQNQTQANHDEVQGLCDGFEGLYGDDWTAASNGFNDDLCWACMAFSRAYIITGTAKWLTLAENNLNTVWSRGEDTRDGGIWWTTANSTKASASNWTFVIAALTIYSHGGGGAWNSRAQVVYNFCKAHLCNTSNGQIYNAYSSTGVTDTFPYTYNFGVAVGASAEMNDSAFCYYAAWYLMNDFPANYYDGQINGYNILPYYAYHDGKSDDTGFNGIVFRWFHYADSHSMINHSFYIAWAQTNISQAWSVRNAYGLSWNQWRMTTPASGLYSWDCSDTLSGMLNVPPTN